MCVHKHAKQRFIWDIEKLVSFQYFILKGLCHPKIRRYVHNVVVSVIPPQPKTSDKETKQMTFIEDIWDVIRKTLKKVTFLLKAGSPIQVDW